MAGPRRPSRAAVRRALTRVVLGACVVATPACKSKKREDPHSLAKLEAQGPPHTPDCRSWEDIDFAKLEALPEAPHMEAFDQVWRTVAQKHYDPTLACLDWMELRQQYAEKIVAAGDDAGAAYAAINELLGLLGQSHLHATAPTQTSTRERETGPAMVPIVVRWLPLSDGGSSKGGEFGAVVVDEAVDGHSTQLPRGAVLRSVAGETIEQVAADAKATLASEQPRATEVAFAIGRAIGVMLSCPEGGTKEITYLDGDDREQTTTVECFVPAGKRVSMGNLRNLPTSVTWRMIGDPERPAEAETPDLDPQAETPDTGAPEPEAQADPPNTDAPAIGYLAFNYWMLPMIEQIRTGVAELRERGMDGLIIDLRGNPGGVGAMSIPLARLFTTKAMSLGRMQMREFNQEFKVEANPEAFTGPIVILVDEGTASTSEIFAVGMRDAGRAQVVGASPSAGMALPSMIDTLPDGGLIQYVVGDYHSAKGSVAEGDGVKPDLEVQESRADFVAGRDPVLDAAVEHLQTKRRDAETTGAEPD